jgi:hypothetical protein
MPLQKGNTKAYMLDFSNSSITCPATSHITIGEILALLSLKSTPQLYHWLLIFNPEQLQTTPEAGAGAICGALKSTLPVGCRTCSNTALMRG